MSRKGFQSFELSDDSDEDIRSIPFLKALRTRPADDQLRGKVGADKQRQGKGRETNAVGAAPQVSSHESDRSSSTTVVATGTKSDASPQGAQPKKKKQKQEQKQAQTNDARLERMRLQACAAQISLLMAFDPHGTGLQPLECPAQKRLFNDFFTLKELLVDFEDFPDERSVRDVMEVFSTARSLLQSQEALGRVLLTEDEI